MTYCAVFSKASTQLSALSLYYEYHRDTETNHVDAFIKVPLKKI